MAGEYDPENSLPPEIVEAHYREGGPWPCLYIGPLFTATEAEVDLALESLEDELFGLPVDPADDFHSM